MTKSRSVFVSGASFAGLATAFWMKKLGYTVTVVEAADGLRKGGTPVNIQGGTVDIARRMGLLEQIRAHRLNIEVMEFKNASDHTEATLRLREHGERVDGEEYEIERDQLLDAMFEAVRHDAEFIFTDGISAMQETGGGIEVSFKSGPRRTFDLVFGCDGLHSAVRRLWFGPATEFVHFMEAYFSITIVDQSLIPENTTQVYSEPGQTVMLNAYNGKTDIIFCFVSEREIAYDHRDEAGQRQIILDRFSRQGWRIPELLAEITRAETFYFDKLCQVKMPAWTKGRVALVGDAGYCASPAAGMGGSLAIDGAAALADAFQRCDGNVEQAFQDYDETFRPFVEHVQAEGVRFGLETFIPRTAEAIHQRNAQFAAL